jgi:hypothetical protein
VGGNRGSVTAAIELAPSPTRIVPAVPTPLDASTAAAHLRQWRETDGASGPLFLALVFIETGAGRKTRNYNPGNVTADDRHYNGDAFRPDWFEVGPDSSPRIKELHDRMLAGQAPKAFRAYADLKAGFSDLLEQLRRNFKSVIDAAQSGNARNFVDALSERYSKDYSPAHYAAFEQLQRKFKPLFADLPARRSLAQRAAGGADLLLPIIAIVALMRLKKGGPRWLAF